MTELNCKALIVTPLVLALMSGPSTLAIAQSLGGSGIAANESIFVDGRSLTIMRGKARGDVSDELRKLRARELGPAALIIRSGDKLFIADNPMPGPFAYAADPNRPYAYDPARGVSAYAVDRSRAAMVGDPSRVSAGYDPARGASYAIDPSRTTTGRAIITDYDPNQGVSAYAADPSRPYRYDPGRGVSAYATDPSGVQVLITDPTRTLIINDPDYAYYRLKKAFDDNWVLSDTKL